MLAQSGIIGSSSSKTLNTSNDLYVSQDRINLLVEKLLEKTETTQLIYISSLADSNGAAFDISSSDYGQPNIALNHFVKELS